MSSSKKITCKETLRQMFYLSEAQNPIFPALRTVYVYTVYCTYSDREGGGGKLNQREGSRGNISQCWVENTIMTDCISIL